MAQPLLDAALVLAAPLGALLVHHGLEGGVVGQRQGEFRRQRAQLVGNLGRMADEDERVLPAAERDLLHLAQCQRFVEPVVDIHEEDDRGLGAMGHGGQHLVGLAQRLHGLVAVVERLQTRGDGPALCRLAGARRDAAKQVFDLFLVVGLDEQQRGARANDELDILKVTHIVVWIITLVASH